MLKIVFGFLIVALFAQEPVIDLDRQVLSTRPHTGTYLELVEIQAVHRDGTGARGVISCSGSWIKYQDSKNQPIVAGWNLPFKTDSRGLIILNPGIGDFEEEPMRCASEDSHGHLGFTNFQTPTNRVTIIVE